MSELPQDGWSGLEESAPAGNPHVAGGYGAVRAGWFARNAFIRILKVRVFRPEDFRLGKKQ